MQVDINSFWKWQQHFPDEQTYIQAAIECRWHNGLQSDVRGHNKGWLI